MERLKSHREFVAVLKRRRRVSSHDLVVHYLIGDALVTGKGTRAHASNNMRRMGLAVSKAVGNAVTRNTVKRRFRVLAAKYEDLLPDNIDLVLRAKPSAANASFQSLDSQVGELFAAVQRKASKVSAEKSA